MIIPSLFAPNLERTVVFYETVLGFERTGAYPKGKAPIWSELTLERFGDPIKLWLFSEAVKDRPQPVFSGTLYCMVDDADAFAQKITDKSCIRWGPEDMDYGLREVGVEDPNGYFLAFASSTD